MTPEGKQDLKASIETKTLYANFRDAKVIQVIKVEVNEGEGIPGDPVTRVVYLTDFNGRVLAKIGEDKDRRFSGEDEMYNFSTR